MHSQLIHLPPLPPAAYQPRPALLERSQRVRKAPQWLAASVNPLKLSEHPVRGGRLSSDDDVDSGLEEGGVRRSGSRGHSAGSGGAGRKRVKEECGEMDSDVEGSAGGWGMLRLLLGLAVVQRLAGQGRAGMYMFRCSVAACAGGACSRRLD